MTEANLTSAEVSFILYLSRYQDDTGRICGVHYKSVCKDLHISYQTFYDIKNSLIEKGLIKQEKMTYIDYDITIVGNDCSDLEQTLKERYINTNHAIFYSPEFHKMKAKEKILAMLFMVRTFTNKASYQILTNNFYDKFCRILSVTQRAIRTYLTSLRKFFAIGIKDHKYFITPKKNLYRKPGQAREEDNYNNNIVQVVCRRNKIDYSDREINDTVGLIRQYESWDKENIILRITRAIIESISGFLPFDRKDKPKLAPSYIHKLLRRDLNLRGDPTEAFI